MQNNEVKRPALVIEYTDPEEGFQGWLVIDSFDHNLCAGGMRIQKGLTKDHLIRMASNMNCKMRICGLRVDGAKSGIDYDPDAPGRYAAVSRFMNAISPYVRSRYSVGPDLNLEMTLLESIGHDLGLPSVKMAVAAAQGWDISYFNERYRVLTQEFEGWPLGKLRVGYGVAVSALAVFDFLAIPHEMSTVAIQGFGALAKAAAYGLSRKGVKIVALADAEKCIISESGEGLNIKHLLETDSTLLPEKGYESDVKLVGNEELYQVPCDILIPGAMEKTITQQVAEMLQVKAVVPGANLAVTDEAEQLLHQKGVPVVPDFLAGCGGSLSMEGLFGPKEHPEPEDIIRHVEKRLSKLVKQILIRSNAENISPGQAALRACTEIVPEPGTRPYGDPQ
jgi:glutamate dehydrogenase (NAD(P)+)